MDDFLFCNNISGLIPATELLETTNLPIVYATKVNGQQSTNSINNQQSLVSTYLDDRRRSGNGERW